TVLFGMGRGGTNLLWSSGITCTGVCLLWDDKAMNLEEAKIGVMNSSINTHATLYRLILCTC
ncbi:hypothetical protein NC77_11055, partial [Janthinobacterium lividum]